MDRRLNRPSHLKAPVDEVMRLEDLYRSRYEGFNVSHFHRKYTRDHGGTRSYAWVKNTSQDRDLIIKGKGPGRHRKRRPRSPYPGMMLLQDGSTHEWVKGKRWDLIVTMDDANRYIQEHYLPEFYEEFMVSPSGDGNAFIPWVGGSLDHRPHLFC